MNALDQQYTDIIREIIDNPLYIESDDRTGEGTRNVLSKTITHDMSYGFPLINCKEVHWRTAFIEMCWMLSGQTNIRPLVIQGCNIWNEWPYEKYKKLAEDCGKPYYTKIGFEEAIKLDEDFAAKFGGLGPVYGQQWRNWSGIDQLVQCIDQIKNDPSSRRILIEGWNVSQIEKMAIPPCHKTYQFTCFDDKLSLSVIQRSCDMFLGVPFNLCNAGLMLALMAKATNKTADKLHWHGINCHIYSNHVEQCEQLLNRVGVSVTFPDLVVLSSCDIRYPSIDELDIANYFPEPHIKADVAV